MQRKNFPSVEHQFKKGQSGNPAGRPKGYRPLKNRLLDIMENTIEYKTLQGDYTQIEVQEALALALVAKALQDGDVKAMEMIRNEVEGSVKQIQADLSLSETQRQIVERALARLLPNIPLAQTEVAKQIDVTPTKSKSSRKK